MARLERHYKTIDEKGAEPIEVFWVRGPAGAVSTWFSPTTKPIIGYSVCAGSCYHQATDDPSDQECEFLDHARCAGEIGSMLHLEAVIEAFDTQTLEPIWQWLEHEYREEIEHGI